MEHLPVLVIGSGLAGLTVALEVAEAGRAVRLIAKEALSESNTRYAQGGIAVALAPGDSPELHAADTLAAGAGLCEPEAVGVLTREAAWRYADLVRRGVSFDQAPDGPALTLEGAHSCRRVVHANGDATGAEVERALIERVRGHARVSISEQTFALDLRVDGARCVGALLLHPSGRIEAAEASAVVLATGGVGRLFRHTTNPPVATADGLAMAFRAGACVRDVEFVQFHPTALIASGRPTFLISEAVRGEGAILRDAAGAAFMADAHPLKDLAPRDVVARAIAKAMARDKRASAWLDLSHLDPALVALRFPTISAVCREVGIRLPQDMVPVAPAAHYHCGGIVTDLNGATTLDGLFAAGEAAWTGVHGANRLASNSLLECAVFAHRVARAIAERAPAPPAAPSFVLPVAGEANDLPAIREALQELMWRHAGLIRNEAGLSQAARQIDAWRLEVSAWLARGPNRPLAELANMLLASALVVKAARERRESRGCHFRDDFPASSPELARHITLSQEA